MVDRPVHPTPPYLDTTSARTSHVDFFLVTCFFIVNKNLPTQIHIKT